MIGLTLILLFFTAVTEARTVTMSWDPVPNAVRYELEVRAGGTRVLTRKFPAKKLEHAQAFSTGTYTYRVRAIDRVGRPGEWSEPAAFVVVPAAPKPVQPAKDAKVEWPAPAEVHFEWKRVKGVRAYRLWVYRGQKTVKEERLTENSATLKLDPGDYEWAVASIVQWKGPAPEGLDEREWAGDPSPRLAFSLREPPKRDIASEMANLGESRAAIAFSGALQHFAYGVNLNGPTGSTSPADTEAGAVTVALESEWWLTERWGIGGRYQARTVHLAGEERQFQRLEGSGRYRVPLGGSWHFGAQSGLGIRQTGLEPPATTGHLGFLGANVGFWFEYRVTDRWRVRLGPLVHFHLKPLNAYAESVDGPFQHPNVDANLSITYLVADHWALRLGGNTAHEEYNWIRASSPERTRMDTYALVVGLEYVFR